MTRTKSMRTAGQSVFSVAPTCVPFSFLVWRASKSSSNYQNNPGRDTIEPSGCGAGRLSEPILSEVDPVVAYSNTTERAAASEQLIVNTILPGLHGVKPDRGRDGWSFHCPLDHRKQNAPAAIWVSDDGWISVHCFDCRRNDELRELLVAPHLRHRSALPVAAPRQSSRRRARSHALTIRSGSGRKQRPSPPTPGIRLVAGWPSATCGDPRWQRRRLYAGCQLPERSPARTPEPVPWCIAGPAHGVGRGLALPAHSPGG